MSLERLGGPPPLLQILRSDHSNSESHERQLKLAKMLVKRKFPLILVGICKVTEADCGFVGLYRCVVVCFGASFKVQTNRTL